MRNFSDIYQEVYVELGEELKELKKANTIRNAIFILMMTILTIIAVIALVSFRNTVVSFFGVLFTILLTINVSSQFGNYSQQYKELVIKKFVKGYSDALEYYPLSGISRHEYNEANFDGQYSEYMSEDLITGTILDNYQISMAEVHTRKEHESPDGGARFTNVFHGLFAIVNLNSSTNISFMIKKNRLFSDILDGNDKLQINSGEFEKIFDVKTNDKISTSRILTSDVIQMLIDFKRINKVTPEIALQGDRLYLRFPIGKVFEPNLVKQDMDFDKLKKYYDIIKFTFNLAEEFSRIISGYKEG